MIDLLHQLDTSLFLFLNSLHSPITDCLMSWISNKWIWTPFYLFLILILYRTYGWPATGILLMVVVLITLSDQSSVLIKNSVQRLRPCHVEDLKGVVHIVNGKCGGKYGFVSSHAANAFALTVFIIPFLKKARGYFPFLMLAWALVISYSRIYLGVHYPGDVIAGALLGSTCGYFCQWLYAKLPANLRVRG